MSAKKSSAIQREGMSGWNNCPNIEAFLHEYPAGKESRCSNSLNIPHPNK
jgi:hypothetical protein